MAIVDPRHAPYIEGMTLSRLLVLLWFGTAAPACAHAHEPLHFRDTPADYAQLGLADAVAVREDGRRTRPGSDDYEWWYLDGVTSDGTVVVVVFSDNWLPGGHRRKVSIEITPPSRPTRRADFTTDDAGTFSGDHADVRIGHSRFQGDLAHYTIEVDPRDTQGLGCALRLERRVPSYRPGTGVMASDDAFFAWVVAVPEGALDGTLTVDGRTEALSGSGYHDHNWGNVEPWALVRNWWWGRGAADGRTVVMAELRPASGRGERALPLLYVASPQGVVAEAHGDAVRLVEGAPAASNDPQHAARRASGVTLLAGTGISSQFLRHDAPITSMDLLAGRSGFVRAMASVMGRSPWYTRWRSAVTIERPGVPASSGEGTIEFMDFE
jgi:hypothetical protein